MDFQRLILFVALSFTLLMIWQAWQEDYGPQPPVAVQEAPSPQVPGAPMDTSPAQEAEVPTTRPALQSAERVHVTTDVLDVEIDTAGGNLHRAALRAYPVSVDQPDNPVVLLNDQPGDLHVVQSGLIPAAGANVEAPNHLAHYRVEQKTYQLESGKDSLEVRLVWDDGQGVEVAKVYTFHRGSYLVDLRFEITNTGADPYRVHLYRQIQRTEPGDSSMFIYTYTGAVYYGPEVKYKKYDFGDMRDARLDQQIQGGWVAMIQHYFLSAWIPPQEQSNNVYTLPPRDGRYTIGMTEKAPTVVAPGQSATVGSQLFVGPKLQEQLEAITPGLELTADYGMLTFISKPLFWLLDLIHSLVGNWGWAIIILTVLIKAAFYKLSETSYKSMAQMRKLQPKMAAMKERYGDDRQKMQEAMMKLYREEKINPLGGCLPILVQIPVFIALYWTLLESVEMRQAPFILWLNDLSSADPYFVLPVLMGATMLIQHRLNPTPMDPIQARVMMILPIIFTVFFAFFPAGLVLYWVVNNTLSIAQQWVITKRIEAA